MDIAEIKRRVDLLKMANNKKYCLIPELAKELKVSKTDLMQLFLTIRNYFIRITSGHTK